jgi:hypothetical protein
MVYEYWNVRQLSTLKPDSSRLVGLSIVPSLTRTLSTFDELLALRKQGREVSSPESPGEFVTPVVPVSMVWFLRA